MKLKHLSPMVCFYCRLNACYEELPICKDCISGLYELLNETCLFCGKTPLNCSCPENKGIRFMYYFGSYKSRMLTYMFKSYSQKNYVAFMAELLVKTCLKGNEKFDAVTYVPRGWRNRNKYGFDQSKKLSEAVGEILNIPVVRALKRKGFKRQKLLSKDQRFKSAKKLYFPREIPETKYKKILLLDDIITTGATILACKSILKEHTAEKVVCAVLCKTNAIIK